MRQTFENGKHSNNNVYLAYQIVVDQKQREAFNLINRDNQVGPRIFHPAAASSLVKIKASGSTIENSLMAVDTEFITEVFSKSGWSLWKGNDSISSQWRVRATEWCPASVENALKFLTVQNNKHLPYETAPASAWNKYINDMKKKSIPPSKIITGVEGRFEKLLLFFFKMSLSSFNSKRGWWEI